jgi:hypothetical protein
VSKITGAAGLTASATLVDRVSIVAHEELPGEDKHDLHFSAELSLVMLCTEL